MALELAKESKCISMQVGCLAVNERGRIIGSGVNGSISGADNCCDVHYTRGPEHSAWADEFEVHAEMNTIIEMARMGPRFNEVSFYTTHSPCANCLKHMMALAAKGQVKVNSIVYADKYYRASEESILANKAYCARFGVELASIDEIEQSHK